MPDAPWLRMRRGPHTVGCALRLSVSGCPKCDTAERARELATFAVLWAFGADDAICRLRLAKLAAKHGLSAPLDALRRAP